LLRFDDGFLFGNIGYMEKQNMKECAPGQPFLFKILVLYNEVFTLYPD